MTENMGEAEGREEGRTKKDRDHLLQLQTEEERRTNEWLIQCERNAGHTLRWLCQRLSVIFKTPEV